MIYNLYSLSFIIILTSIFLGIRFYIKQYEKEFSIDHYIVRARGGTTFGSPYYCSFKKYYNINSKFNIKLIHENWMINFLKNMNLIKKFKTQNNLFDNTFFILNDDITTHENLAKNNELLDELNKLNSELQSIGWKIKYIKSNNGHLSIYIKAIELIKMSEKYTKYLENIIDNYLYKIKNMLEKSEMISSIDKNEETYKKIKKYSKFLFIISFILFTFIGTVKTEYQTIELISLLKQSFLIGIGGLSIYLFLIFKKFKHNSRLYEVLVLPSFAIFFAIFLSSYIIIYFSH